MYTSVITIKSGILFFKKELRKILEEMIFEMFYGMTGYRYKSRINFYFANLAIFRERCIFLVQLGCYR